MKKILLVDDEVDILEFLKYNLEQEKFEVLVSSNGKDALKNIEQNPDLIVLDIMMPEMDGHDLIHAIRQDMKTAKLPVIVQSAYLGVKGTKSLMEEGVDAVIPKPIDGKYLMDHIARHIAMANRSVNPPAKMESALT